MLCKICDVGTTLPTFGSVLDMGVSTECHEISTN